MYFNSFRQNFQGPVQMPFTDYINAIGLTYLLISVMTAGNGHKRYRRTSWIYVWLIATSNGLII